MTYTFYR